MYDINLENLKKSKKFYLIFLTIGLLLLVIFCVFQISHYMTLSRLDSITRSTRIITNEEIDDEGDVSYSPVYYYEVRGIEYMCSSNLSSNIKPNTSNEKVYYNSKNPKDCMTEYSKKNNKMFFIILAFSLILLIIGLINIMKINKRIRIIDVLNQKGKLVKNLPYQLENTGVVINDVPIQRPVVEYTLDSGSTITLHGDPRHDRKWSDEDGMVDLVIDESNPNNYFIDFEINRLSGNLPSDYYDEGQIQPENNQELN